MTLRYRIMACDCFFVGGGAVALNDINARLQAYVIDLRRPTDV